MNSPPDGMTLQQLRTYCEVVRWGSFAETSRRLGMSTPAAWAQVRSLERYFGVVLLRRQGRGVKPTQEGIRLYELLRPLLAGIHSAREVIRQESGVPPEWITIATGFRMIMEEMSEALAQFQRIRPAVRLRVIQAGSDEVAPLIASGEVDMALTLEPDSMDRPGHVVYEPAYANEFLLILPKRHPLAKGSPFRFRDIADWPLVVGREAVLRRRVDGVFHMHGLLSRVNIRVETSNAAATVACVRAGMGIGIITGRRNGNLAKGLAERSLRRWFGEAQIVFALPRGVCQPPAIEKLLSTIRAVANRNH